MAYTDVNFARKLMERELLRGANAEDRGIAVRDGHHRSKGRILGPAGKYLEKYFDEQRRNKAREPYTDFQDSKPQPAPPTNYSYLSNGYGG